VVDPRRLEQPEPLARLERRSGLAGFGARDPHPLPPLRAVG